MENMALHSGETQSQKRSVAHIPRSPVSEVRKAKPSQRPIRKNPEPPRQAKMSKVSER